MTTDNNKTTEEAIMQHETTEFNGIKMDIIKQQDDFYLTSDQIGDALEYRDSKKAINNIYIRNKDLLDEYSTTLKLRVVDGKKHNTRVFNEEGAMIIAMKSNKPKAIEFQKWAVNILKQYRLGKITSTATTNPQLPDLTRNYATHEIKEDECYISSIELSHMIDIEHDQLMDKVSKFNNLHKNNYTARRFNYELIAFTTKNKKSVALIHHSIFLLFVPNDKRHYHSIVNTLENIANFYQDKKDKLQKDLEETGKKTNRAYYHFGYAERTGEELTKFLDSIKSDNPLKIMEGLDGDACNDKQQSVLLLSCIELSKMKSKQNEQILRHIKSLANKIISHLHNAKSIYLFRLDLDRHGTEIWLDSENKSKHENNDWMSRDV